MTWIRAAGLRIVLAVGLSFALWAFVSFSENPESQITFEDMPVEVRSLVPDLVMVDQNGLPNPSLRSVDVVVETDQSTRNKLRQVDFTAFVDLSDLDPGDHSVPVNVDPTRPNLSFRIPEIDPPQLQIRLENVITKTAPITLEVQGNVPFSFELGEPQIRANGEAVEETVVKGPQSRVERVVTTRTVANVEQLRAIYVSSLQLQAIDENGQVIEGVTLDPDIVNVRIPINPVVGLKLVPVLGNIIGLPAEGYAVVEIQSDPALISLTGSSGTLDTVESVKTEAVDISGFQSTTIRDVALQLPVGTSLQRGEPSMVRVTVQIEPLERPFQVQIPISVRVVGQAENVDVNVTPVIVIVPLAGTTGNLESLSVDGLTARIDVSGLLPGTYTLTPTIDLPDGINIVGDLPEVIVTLRALATPTPTATPETTATAAPETTVTPENEPTPDATPTVQETAAPSDLTERTPTPGV